MQEEEKIRYTELRQCKYKNLKFRFDRVMRHHGQVDVLAHLDVAELYIRVRAMKSQITTYKS